MKGQPLLFYCTGGTLVPGPLPVGKFPASPTLVSGPFLQGNSLHLPHLSLVPSCGENSVHLPHLSLVLSCGVIHCISRTCPRPSPGGESRKRVIYSLIPSRSNMNAYSSAVVFSLSNLPEAPPWPAVMLTSMIRILLSVFISRSLATHFAGSQY